MRILDIYKKIGPYVFLGCFVIAVFGKTLYLPSNKLVSGGDLQLSHYYYQTYVRDSLRDHELPFWNPYSYSGQPFLADPAVNMFYPVNWLLYIFPLNVAFSWHMAFHIFLAMAGMYWLLRRFMHTIPALIGALAFGLSGKLATGLYVGYYDMISSASYFPLTVGSIWLAAESRKRAFFFLAVGVFTLQILSGYQTMTMFTVQAAALVVCFLSVKQRRVQPFLFFLLIIVCAIGLTAFQLLPTQQLLSLSTRSLTKVDSWFYYGQLPLNSLWMLWNPFLYGTIQTYSRSGMGLWEHALYIGKLPLLLAISGIVVLGGRIIQWIHIRKTTFPIILGVVGILLAIFGFWISIGKEAPINLMGLMIKYIPWYGYIRIPPRHLFYTDVGMAILAGIGAECLYAWKRGRMAVCLFFLIVTCLDLFVVTRTFIVPVTLPDLRQDPQLLTYFEQHKKTPLFRFHQGFNTSVAPIESASLDFSAPMKYRLFSNNGYDIVVLNTYQQFMNASNHVDTMPFITLFSPALSFLNVKYIDLLFTDDPLNQTSSKEFTHIFTNKERAYSFYEKNNTLPRFYQVPHAITLPSQEQVYNQILHGFDKYDDSVLLVGSDPSQFPTPTCSIPNTSGVSIVQYNRNNITLSTSFPCSGYLVSSEVMYPGWEAYIDGKRTQLWEGNLAFRTIFVPAGSHTVEMRYYPRIFLIGVFVSFTTLSLILFWIMVPAMHTKR